MASCSSTKEEEDYPQYTCPVCLEIFEKPVLTSCGHTYCAGCLKGHSSVAEPQCPLCRQVFNPATVSRNATMERAVASVKTHCTACHRKMSLSKLRGHQLMCSKMKVPMPVQPFTPVAPTTQPPPLNSLNRSTFTCPYCGMRNLDNSALIKHCNEQHRNSNAAVVCPVCVSMPWGNPNQTSTNFIQHLNLRHRFEYDTYVDYSQDEDAMLQLALKASLTES